MIIGMLQQSDIVPAALGSWAYLHYQQKDGGVCRVRQTV